ncbi:MAG: hypothetical protein A3K19_15520 [Lentisphaerae bacterium RIFOXYB12_FULL_65_16]|nr:MAG: hypothetical protein A3K18_26425 [Lentisphaerae bacterium RIFOXYA12_64_32]OGV88508.1 MAG: hypothetical protein A3K19_15520 [Lentisphaerae bacterium RIFOXYB12_FULL_65_16]
MPFQLHIRHNLDSAADHFAAGDVRSFDRELVRVGSSPDADVRLGEEGCQPTLFLLLSDAAGRVVRLKSDPGACVFVGQARVEDERQLASGDEIRVGHWTFRFQRVYARAGLGRRAGLMSLTARALVVFILVMEIGGVVWLPRQMRSAMLWEEEIARQRALTLLDSLRDGNRPSEQETEMERTARETVGRELDALARHVRQYEEALTRDEWGRIMADLRGYEQILNRLARRQVFQPVPPLDVEGGVTAVLKAHGVLPEGK